ncbi:DNA polymerase III subunit delta [Pseudostreptobacillus sp.]
MIHFIQGLSSKTIYLEALLNKLNIDNISRFDETNSEFFLNEINSGSLFSEPKIVLLKNAEKIKDLHQILEKLENHENTNEEIIIVYNSIKENKKINDLTKKFNNHFIFDTKINKKNFLEYIAKKLKIKDNEANQLLDLLEEDYYLITNELDKINNFLNGKPYSLDNIKPILSKTSKFIIFELTNDILNNRKINFPIKEHMGILSSLVNDFDLIYKLHVSKIKDNNYNNFKEIIKNLDIFNSYSPYYVFKKQEFLNKFTKKECLDFLKLAFKTELMIKTGEIDFEVGVENFIMNICKKH